MARARPWLMAAATLLAAIVGTLLFRALHLPLAAILGSMFGSAVIANLFGAMPGGRNLRRSGQLFVGASVGAILTPDALGELYRLFPLMLGVAIASNVLGFILAFPLAKIAGLDRLTAVLSSLPAGMAEMATLAVDLKADEQAVAIVHTIRVVMVLMLIPVWIGFVAPGSGPALLSGWNGIAEITILVLAAAILAHVATLLNVINAWIIAPMLLCLLVVGAGHSLPPVPRSSWWRRRSPSASRWGFASGWPDCGVYPEWRWVASFQPCSWPAAHSPLWQHSRRNWGISTMSPQSWRSRPADWARWSPPQAPSVCWRQPSPASSLAAPFLPT